MTLRAGLGARGPIVAVGHGVARLGLLGDQPFPASPELCDGDDLDHVSLPGHQRVDTLQRIAGALAEPPDLGVVADIAVGRRLSRPDEGVVLPSESVDIRIQFVQVHMCRGQPLVVFGFQPPCECAAQAGRASPKRERFGTVRVAELLFDECEALAGDPRVRGREIIRPRRGITQPLSGRLSSRIRASRKRPSLMLRIDASTLSIWLLNSSSARPYMSAARPSRFRLPYACGRASMASWTATSVGSRSTRMLHGTSARSYSSAEASAQ